MKSRIITFAVLAISMLFIGTASASASSNLYYATGDDSVNSQALAFSLSADGTPALIQTFTGASEADSFFNAVSMSPDGKFLFMADYDADQLRSFSVAADGKLTNAPGSPTNLPGSGPYGSAVTPDGKYVIFGLYDGHGVQSFAIGANGSLSGTPGGVSELAPGAQPYGVGISTDSRTLYVPDPSTNSLYILRIGADGSLTELPGSPIPTGTNVNHVAVTPDGKYLYLPNYDDDNVYGYSLASDGMPTALPGSPFSVMTDVYGGFAISPNGKTLYSSGSSDSIQSASIAPDGGLAAGPSITVGDYNPGLAMNPSGTRLYNGVDGSPTNVLNTYSVDGTGALTPFGVSLPIGDDLGPDLDSMVVSPAQSPVAALVAKSGLGGEVSLDASGSTDSDGTIASYGWDFGDGQTATTTMPTTGHTYATDGSYPVSVTLTDSDSCSTKVVFTGRTVYCNGSAAAKASATAVADKSVAGAKVTAAKVQKQKGKKLLVKVKARASETVQLEATGSATLKKVKGKVNLKKAKGQAAASTPRVLKLTSKSTRKVRAAIGRKGKATIRVKMTDPVGNTVSKKITIRLK